MSYLPSLTGQVAVPLWMLAAGAAAVAAFIVLAMLRSGAARAADVLLQAGAVVVLLALGWAYLDHADRQERSDKRRALETRLLALEAQALAPNSSLACLTPAADSTVEDSCEKAIYASPERVAAALAFVGAEIDLLREIAALPDVRETDFASMREPLIKRIEADRYGLVAQVLQGRDGCSVDDCDAFAWLKDRESVVGNMQEGAFRARVARYSAAWDNKPAGTTAPALAAHSTGLPGNPVNINFPSSASIPPVSIMSNEPGMPGQNGVDAGVKPDPRQAQPPTPPRRPQKTAAPRAPAQQATGAPVQIAPQ